MAQRNSTEEIRQVRLSEWEESQRSLDSSFFSNHGANIFETNSSASSSTIGFRSLSSLFDRDDYEHYRSRYSVDHHHIHEIIDEDAKFQDGKGGLFMEKLITNVEKDNLELLQKIKTRIDKVGVELAKVEVRYKNLCVEAECEVVHGKPLPTLWNSLTSSLFDVVKLCGWSSRKAKIKVIDDVSGVIKPGRITLLLGHPGCGKTTLLKALSGQLNPSLKVTGEISYNGYKLEEFVPQKTSAYVSQYDLHISEITVRETLDFSARFQGVGSGEEIMTEVSRREKEAGIIPDPDIDSYMKAVSTKGKRRTLQTDYTLKILGLDVCSDTIVGDAEERGISGGQKKRLTTGEMIVGPRKVLFMDEITNGIDSSTAIQMVACLQQFAHTSDATILVSLLQPPPEAFDLFDDILLMAEGKVVYHGPRNQVLDYFEYCGFKCPSRKAVADFLQEVTSKKDQAQYWYSNEQSYSFVSVDSFVQKFKASPLGKEHDEQLSEPCAKSQKERRALSFSPYSLSKWELFRTCMSKEILLIKRNYFIYLFQTIQLVIIAFMTMTVFLRTRMDIDVIEANYFMGALFYGLISLLLDGIPELSMTVARLPVYYKQKELCFYPAWAYAIPAAILKIPLSLVQSLVWTSLTYFVIGYSPQLWRFICQFILLFTVHLTSLSMFRFVASVFRTMEASMVAGSFVILLVLLFGGFIIEQPSMPVWLKWGFWLSPLTYGEIGLSLNEFLAPRWQKVTSTNTTIGHATLQSRGLHFDEYFFWMSLGVLVGFTLVFNIGFNLALSFLKSPELSRAIISHEKLHHSHIQGNEDVYYDPAAVETSMDSHSSTNRETRSSKGGMILPFQPLTVTFKKMQYYVDTPLEMRKRGFDQKKLQLLSDISGAFRPGVLTALMGVSGAGKTTLLDVLAGRKTSGYIEGSIKIGGYSKVQETFARISGYCEQMDVHSPQLTIEESLIFSACLRLSPQIDSNVKAEFVNEVLETIELDGIKDTLVGIPSVSGLSAEQRKRLTIAVELVANPSIIFMDEPTSGLDARAAAIVMRTVKKIADAGRTIVCTIHQPSIDIFEAFDELILLKHGGRIIYSGPLGQNSRNVIEYFEGIPGVPKIKGKTNPATWMLEVTSTSAETKLGVDFAQIYRDSALYKNNKGLITNLSNPSSGSKDLHFPTNFSRNGWEQFKSCLWKQHLTYWRSPSYNLMRIVHALISSVLFGLLFWKQGQKLDNQQDLFNILGSMNTAVIFLGINNCSSALQYVARERTVMYRERFAGMYSSWAYALAQVMIEIPYILIQTITFVIITYPMIGYYVSAFKIFWYFYGMFCSLLYYNYLGMLLVSLTPNFIVAGILTMPFYSIFNLFSGFLIPHKQIPKWWIWLYNLTPTSWALEGLILSQYGDIHTKITVFGEIKTVSGFLHDYFGYQYGQLSFVAAVTVVFPLAYATLFAFFIGRLNFQRR